MNKPKLPAKAKPKKWKRSAELTNRMLASNLTDLLNLPRGRDKCEEGQQIVRAMWASMSAALRRGESIHIKGLGWFRPVVHTFSTNLPNCRGMKKVHKRKIIRFYPSRELKESMRKNNG